MASNYPPKKNVAFTMGFFIYKNDGTIIANPTLTGSNVHTDLGTTEVTNSTLAVVDSTTGLCSIALAQGTMNGDQIDGTITSSSTGAVVYTFKLMTTANTQDEIGAVINGDHGLVSIQDDIDAILLDTGTDGVKVASFANDAITAASINTGAFTADAFAADAIVAATLATGVITADAFAADSIVAATLATGAIAADAFDQTAADKIWSTTARVLTANTNLSIPTVAGIVDGVWDEAISDHTTGTTFGGKNQKVVPSETINDYKATGFSTHSAADVKTAIEAAGSSIASILEDTGTTLDTLIKDIPTTAEFELRTLPVADYTIVSDLGTVQTGDTYAKLPTNFEHLSITDTTGLVDITQTAADKPWGTTTRVLTANTNLSIPTTTSITDAIWDEVLHTDHEVSGSASVLLQGATAPSAADVSNAVWDEVLHTDHEVAGSASVLLQAAGSAGDPWVADEGAAVYAAVVTNAAGTDIAADIIALKAETVSILVDTDELQTNQGDWATATGFATATELDKVPKSDSDITWNATALASINAEIVDVIAIDTVAEMTTGAPPASPTIKQLLNYLYRKLRNKNETTNSENKVYDDAGTTILFKEAHTDDGTTFIKGKFGGNA